MMGDVKKLIFDARQGTLAAPSVRPPRTASYSALSTFDTCPGMWVAGRVYKEPRRYNDPLTIGGIAHAALELAMRDPATLQPDWPRLCREGIALERERNSLPENRWKGDPLPQGVLAPDGHAVTEGEWADMAAARLRGFRLDLALNRPPTPAACEERIDADVWGVPMTGSVDYRDQSGQVVDWKTGRLPALDSPKASQHATQLRVYKALLATRGITVTDARDVYVEHNTAHPADLSEASMDATGTWVEVTWKDMHASAQRGAYALKPGPLCPWCPLSRVCPLAGAARGAKARAVMDIGLGLDDPEVRVEYADACTGVTKRQGGGMGLLDMLDELDSKPKPEPKPEPKPGVDPWRTPEGKAAAERWGFDDTTELGGEPKPEPKPKAGVRVLERRPYDPSSDGEGHINMAGYGIGQLQLMASTAYRLAPDDARHALLLLIRAEWAAARGVWGDIVPDIPGLDADRPDRDRLLAWLDTSLSRDIDRITHDMLERHTDGDLPSRIGAAGRDALATTRLVRTLVEE